MERTEAELDEVVGRLKANELFFFDGHQGEREAIAFHQGAGLICVEYSTGARLDAVERYTVEAFRSWLRERPEHRIFGP